MALASGIQDLKRYPQKKLQSKIFEFLKFKLQAFLHFKGFEQLFSSIGWRVMLMQNDAKKWIMRDFQGNLWIKKFRRSCTSSAKYKECYDRRLVILINFQELRLHMKYAN